VDDRGSSTTKGLLKAAGWIQYGQMIDDPHRRTPDELLADIELEERRKRRGKLKVFLGYASGVGKSFQMLDEGRRRRERGEDVVACALQPDYPPEERAIIDQLEVIPTIVTDCGDAIDLPRVMIRRPEVALIDGLAYDNPPGCTNSHRWQDVEQLLNAGISVLTTVNIQYLENLQEEIERITGNRAAYIIPRTFLTNSADEITVVDAPSEESVLGGIEDRSFQLAEKHKLSRLRELALLVAASVVDRQLESYLRSQGTEQTWGVQERILVCVTAQSNAAEMLESGRRNADRFQGEFYVAYFEENPLPGGQQELLAKNLGYAHELGAEVHDLTDSDPVTAILEFAMQRGITQIFVGRISTPPDFWTRLRGNLAARLIRAAEGIDVIVYPHR
jgi:two-component system sensor histidine kinase KdpD